MSDVMTERIQTLNDAPIREDGAMVVYWMEQSQRARHNDALIYALRRANEHDLPLRVVYGLDEASAYSTVRHFTFLLEGLHEVQADLADAGIQMVVQRGAPDAVALQHADDAALLVCDRGYMRQQKAWRARVADKAPCRVMQVEADVTVPVDLVTDKAEYAARTIRPKIHEHLERFLVLPERPEPAHPSTDLPTDALSDVVDLSDVDAVVEAMDVDASVPPVRGLFRGGTSEAEAILDTFLAEKFDGYDDNRNQIQTNAVSHMSKYLHFGQISTVWLTMQVQQADAPTEDIESYVEELVVRRELAINHVHFRPDTYDDFSCIPGWAQETLEVHEDDEREYVYTLEEFEHSETHDPYWNAAMKEQRETGYMHNYMRMYWGKKILEWSPDPKTAFDWALHLNNKYFLDGSDPNSYAGVLWLFGLHDRGWKEREVYGKVRYMSQGGLKRKADPEAYVAKVDRLADAAPA